MLLSVCLKAFSTASKVYINSVQSSGQSAFLALSMRSAISFSRFTDLMSWVRSNGFGKHRSSPTAVGMRLSTSATTFSLFFVISPSGLYELAELAITLPHSSNKVFPSESSECLVFRHLGLHGQSPPPPPNNPPRPSSPPRIPATGLRAASAPSASSPIPPLPNIPLSC